MKKGCRITAIVTAILILSFIIFVFYFLYTFSSGMTGRVHITETNLDVRYSIKFDYVTSPLSANFIQVLKIDNKTKEEYLLENYDNYDNMVGYCLQGDSMTIYLKGGYRVNKQSSNYIECDTFHLNINDVKLKL